MSSFVQTPEFKSFYPFESKYLDLGGHRMHYVDEGRGDVLVCLHGNPTWSFYYRNIIREFSKTHRVIAPDHLGCGFSDKPANYEYRLKRHIENIEVLLLELGVKRCTLMLHDWGGAIGMGFAVKHPDMINGFVLLNTAAFPSERIPLRISICRWPLIGEFIVRGLNGFAGAAVYMAVKGKMKMPANLKKGYLAPYDNWANRIAVHRFVKDIPMKKNHPSYAVLDEISAGLGQFQDSPMLLLWGMKDFCFNAHFLREWKERFPDAEVHEFRNAGHYVLEDASAEILPLVTEFLESLKAYR